MPTNDFLPFATGAGANVTTQTDYSALAARSSGFSSGVASSAQINKALRQASFVAAALAQFTADNQSGNVADDGVIANFKAQLTAAIQASSFGRLLNIKIFNASGTYTPSAGTKSVVVETVGGGGGGASAPAVAAGSASTGGGGGGGAYAKAYIASVAASVPVTIGAAGAAGLSGGSGSNGGTTSFGSYVASAGGSGGSSSSGSTAPVSGSPGAGATTTSFSGGAQAIANIGGQPGTWGIVWTINGNALGGAGGASVLGSGGNHVGAGSGGNTGAGYGGGGSGSCQSNGGASPNGGAGSAGLIIVYEYA